MSLSPSFAGYSHRLFISQEFSFFSSLSVVSLSVSFFSHDRNRCPKLCVSSLPSSLRSWEKKGNTTEEWKESNNVLSFFSQRFHVWGKSSLLPILVFLTISFTDSKVREKGFLWSLRDFDSLSLTFKLTMSLFCESIYRLFCVVFGSTHTGIPRELECEWDNSFCLGEWERPEPPSSSSLLFIFVGKDTICVDIRLSLRLIMNRILFDVCHQLKWMSVTNISRKCVSRSFSVFCGNNKKNIITRIESEIRTKIAPKKHLLMSRRRLTPFFLFFLYNRLESETFHLKLSHFHCPHKLFTLEKRKTWWSWPKLHPDPSPSPSTLMILSHWRGTREGGSLSLSLVVSYLQVMILNLKLVCNVVSDIIDTLEYNNYSLFWTDVCVIGDDALSIHSSREERPFTTL